eukprot:RCo001897
MALSDWVFGALGRELSTGEREMLLALSPQGVAKINADIAKGVSLERTLSQLEEVFRVVKHRQALTKSMVPKTLLPVVGRMGRPPTTDELVLLVGTPATVLLRQLDSRTKKGEVLEDVMEELAEENRLELMRRDALCLADGKGVRARLNFLSPTGLHPSCSFGLTVSLVEAGSQKRPRVGPSPHVSWFSDPVQGTLVGCAALSSPASIALPSTLKKALRPALQYNSSTSTLGPESDTSSPCSNPEAPEGLLFDLAVPTGSTTAPAKLRVSFPGLPGDSHSSKPKPLRKRQPVTMGPSTALSPGQAIPRAIQKLRKLKKLVLG